MKIIDRYIMSEMLGPFLFGVCAFTLLFFSAETLMGVAKMILEAQAGVGMVTKTVTIPKGRGQRAMVTVILNPGMTPASSLGGPGLQASHADASQHRA